MEYISAMQEVSESNRDDGGIQPLDRKKPVLLEVGGSLIPGLGAQRTRYLPQISERAGHIHCRGMEKGSWDRIVSINIHINGYLSRWRRLQVPFPSLCSAAPITRYPKGNKGATRHVSKSEAQAEPSELLYKSPSASGYPGFARRRREI